MGITVIGSLNYDIVTFTDRVPQAGETLKGNFFETHAGGKGLNQTIALAKLKNNESPYSIKMVGSVGDDAFGKQLVNLLKENQIDVSDVQVVANKSTGVATIIVEQKNGGQNRIILTEGANGSSVYSDQELSQIFGGEGASPNRKQYVVFQNEIPHPCSIMTWIKKYRPNFQIVYNPSPFYPMTKEQWSLVDILVVNEVEALQIVEAVYDPKVFSEYKSKIGRDFLDGYKEICRDFQLHLVNQTNDAVVVITLGENGALYSSKQNPGVGYASAVSGIKVVDTTAAGDTFLGALITQLHQDVTLGSAIEFATKASSIGIQRSGAAESIPSFKEVA